MPAMTWSALRCSSTIMARRPTARAPAAPAATSTMPAPSPSGSAFPHYVLDYEDRFKEAVIERFAQSYVAGETPVPCVECNQSIKFRDLLGTARELGAKVLATGHYIASRALPDGGRALYRAREAERDQSYFLFATTRAQLDLLRFPLGDRSKAETRELGAPLRPCRRRQAGQPGHLLRADRALCAGDRAAAAGRVRPRRHCRSRRPRARPS